MIFAFTLLATLSIVNAILHKRATTFEPCDADPYPTHCKLCMINGCPATYISGEIGKVYVSAVLPKPYTITVTVAERTAKSGKEALGCTFASVW
nr:9612_t:CDS:2 [Entrophospora candida]